MGIFDGFAEWFEKLIAGKKPDVPEIPDKPIEMDGYTLPSLKDFGKKSEWIPWAKQPNGKRMPTRGTYTNKFPKGFVVHFTDGWSIHGESDALNTIDGGISDGYCYLVNDRNGVIYQTFPLSAWGYHAGGGVWPNLPGALNAQMVGCETCGLGQAVLKSDGKYGSKEQPGMTERWSKDDVRTVPDKQNMHAGTYLKFSPAQEKALVELILWMAVQSGMGHGFIDNVVGHDEIAPAHRDDPGGSLSMTTPDFRAFLHKLYDKIT